MTKKDYKLIASALADAVNANKKDEDAIARVVDFLSEKFGQDNPRFDRNKFSIWFMRHIDS